MEVTRNGGLGLTCKTLKNKELSWKGNGGEEDLAKPQEGRAGWKARRT
jgi:hypothetical protein